MHACSATKSCEVFGICEVVFEPHLKFCEVFRCCEVCMHVYKFCEVYGICEVPFESIL